MPCPECGVERLLKEDKGQSCSDCGRRKKAKAPLGLKRLTVTCPVCRVVREVNRNQALQILTGKRAGLCQSCGGKRRVVAFESRLCVRCGDRFQARAGQSRAKCDVCSTRKPPPEPRHCVVCNTLYAPKRVERRSWNVCSVACRQRMRTNKTHFGGRMFEAQGWDSKECQCCGRSVPKGFHVHHVYGYPDHSKLMLLCAGCHQIVTLIARMKHPAIVGPTLVQLALLQRGGQILQGEDVAA